MSSTHFDTVEPITLAASDSGAISNLGNAAYGDWTPKISPTKDTSVMPAFLSFTPDIYGVSNASQSATSPLGNSDLAAVTFTTPAQDAVSGVQPNFYLNSEGTLVPNPAAKPNSDGSINIEVTGNDSAQQAKQYADKLQKQTISDLITQFKALYPGETVPEMWQAIVASQPDANYPNQGDTQNNNSVTPADEQIYNSQIAPTPPTDTPPPPTDTSPPPVTDPSGDGQQSGGTGSNGSSGGDGGSGGDSGGGSSGGSGGDSSGGSPSISGSLPAPIDNGSEIESPSDPKVAQLESSLGNDTGSNAVRDELSQLGTPYVYAGETAGKEFDCSGLTDWAYDKAEGGTPQAGVRGQSIGRTAADQETFCEKNGTMITDMSQLKPGDLLFYNEGASTPQHVAMYAGEGMMIEAPHTGERVRLVPILQPDAAGRPTK
jgi:cell wall-associated NlpC family hydrolase